MLRLLFVLLAFAATALAQDRVTLKNGDVLTGVVKTMAGGKLVLENPLLGEITVPFAEIENLATSSEVQLLTTEGDLLRRRIAGIEAGQLKFGTAGEGAPSLSQMALGMLEQINPPPEQPVTWTGSVTIGGSYISGNTDRRAMTAQLQATRRAEIDRIFVDASWDYAEDKKRDDPLTPADESGWDLTQRRTGAGFKYDYFLTKRWYALVTARVLGDTLADLDLRFTSGVGIGYQWIETDTVKFATEVGISYLNENYRSDTPSRDAITARVAYRYQRQLAENTRLTHSVEAFPSLEDIDDVYFQASTQLENKLFGDMVAQLGWVWDYDNTPAPGRERSDHRLTLSFGWAF